MESGATSVASRPWRALGLLASLAVLAVAVRWTLLTGPARDYDEGVFWESVRLLGRGAALGDVYSSQPPLFLLLLRPIDSLLGGGLPAARATIVILAALGAAGGAVAVARLGGRAMGGAIAGALLVADPSLLVAGGTLQAEGPCIALALLAVAVAALAGAQGRRSTWLLAAAGALAALACLTKLLALPVAAPLVVLALMPGEESSGADTGLSLRARPRLAALMGGAGAATAAVLLPLHDHWSQLAKQEIALHLGASRDLALGGLGPASHALLLEAPLAILGIAGAILAVRAGARRGLVALGSWALLSMAAVGAQHPLWPHHLAAGAAPTACLAGLGIGPAIRSLGAHRARSVAARVVLGAAAAALGWAALVGGHDAATARTTVDRPETVASVVSAALPPGTFLLTDDQALAAAGDIPVPPALVDTSLVRVDSGDLTLATVADSSGGVGGVLLGTGRLARIPGFSAWIDRRFPVATPLPEGRILRTATRP